jgi:hypothetical protein
MRGTVFCRIALALILAWCPGAGKAQLQGKTAGLPVPFLRGEVALDGRLEEPQWRTAARLTHADFGLWKADRYEKDPSELVVRFFHDGKSLYVAIASYDRFVQGATPPENSDGLYSFSVATRKGPIQHYRLRWSADPPVAGGEMISPGKWGARLRGPFGDASREGGGYVLEFAVPLAAIGWKAGDRVPVNLIVQDFDGPPGARYNDPGVEFARFFWGGLDNEARAAFRALILAPR